MSKVSSSVGRTYPLTSLCHPTRWDDFKPDLQALPSAPELLQLKLPPFRAPILDTEVPFIEPLYLPLPDIPEGPEVRRSGAETEMSRVQDIQGTTGP